MRMRRQVFVAGAIWSFLIVLLLSVHSQVASAQNPPGTPETGACAVEPLDLDRLTAIAALPAATADGRTPNNPAPAEIRHEIVSLVAQTVDCANANDPLRSLALFTDRYLADRFGTAHPDDLASLVAAASRQPIPASVEDRLMLVSVVDVRAENGERASAIVTTKNGIGLYVDQLIFVKNGGDWKIDSWSETGLTATPVA